MYCVGAQRENCHCERVLLLWDIITLGGHRQRTFQGHKWDKEKLLLWGHKGGIITVWGQLLLCKGHRGVLLLCEGTLGQSFCGGIITGGCYYCV